MLPGPTPSGVGLSIRELLASLVTGNPDDQFVVYASANTSQCLPKLENVKCVHSALAGRGRPFRIFWQQVILPLIVHSENIDLYHATGYVVSPHLAVPTIVTVYDTIALERPELTTWRNALHFRWFMKRGIQSADCVLVPSDYVKKRLVAVTGISPQKIRKIPLGISSHFTPICRKKALLQLRHSIGIDCEEFVLFVGNIERKKNLPTLVRAFAEWKRRSKRGTKLILVGKPSNASQEVAQTIERMGLKGETILTGYVDDEQLAALYNAATILVYPSLEEGFGLPPLEAMACGTSVIASDLPPLRETTEHVAVLVDPCDVGAWSEALEEVMSSKELREEMRQAGLLRALQYTWDKTSATVHECYRTVAKVKSNLKAGVAGENR